jgi:hypothetical protein
MTFRHSMLGANSIVAIAALVLMPPSRLAAQKDAIASLAATKSSYLLGEPIALKLRVTNNSASTVSIIGNYPTFAYNAAIGIKCALISIPSRASATHRNSEIRPSIEAPQVRLTISGSSRVVGRPQLCE